jgi:hypothetical protein
VYRYGTTLTRMTRSPLAPPPLPTHGMEGLD